MAAAPQAGGRGKIAIAAIIAAVVLGGVGLWQGWWALPGQEQAPSRAARSAPPVRVAPLIVQDVPMRVHTLGRVQASAKVEIKARVEGQVQETAFTDGQLVQAGDLLVRLDPEPYQIALQEAEAALARDQAQLNSAQSDVNRYGSLSQKGYASTQQYEQAVAQARALRASVAASQALVAQAQLMLAYTEIKAPMDGVLGAAQVDPGNLVDANGDTPLVTLYAVRPVKVRFTLPQQYLPAIQHAQSSAISKDGQDPQAGVGVDVIIPPPPGGLDETLPKDQQGGRHLEGHLTFVSPEVDSTTGTVALLAQVENESRILQPGQYVDVSLRLGLLKERMTVPPEALSNGQQGPFILIVDGESKAQVQTVTVHYQDDAVAVISAREGGTLIEGMPVVIDGQVRVRPGGPVQVKSAPSVQQEG